MMEVFIDNFAVFSNRSGYLRFLKKTFERCRETNLKLHPGKCFLGMTSRVLLGHIVSKKGLEVDMEKIQSILTLAPLTCV